MYEAQIEKAVKKYSLGKGEITVSKLGTGENNISMLAETTNKKFVFRIGIRKENEKNMKTEYEYIKKLPPNIGPKTILFDASKKIIPKVYSVLSYIEGKHATNWKKAHLRMHAHKLAELHRKKYNYWGREKNRQTFNIYDCFMNEARVWNKIYTFKKDTEISEIFAKMEKYTKEKNHLFTALKKFSRIHTDPSMPNILFTKQGVRYIDWELTTIRDNAEDFQQLYYEDSECLPWKIRLTGAKLKYYHEKYTEKIPDRTLAERAKAWQQYYKFFDLTYFKWKIRNFHKENSAEPLETYKKGSRVMARGLRKAF